MQAKILIINNALDQYCTEFIEPIKKYFPEAHVVHYRHLTQSLLDAHDGYVLSGTPLRDTYAVREALSFYAWLKQNQKPVLGICAGHQVMGKIFGAELRHGIEEEVGYYQIKIHENDELFDGLLLPESQSFRAFALHYDSVSLPSGFQLLAGSKRCEVEVMKHREFPVYGVQFHPERSNPAIMNNFACMVGAVSYAPTEILGVTA